MDIRKQWEEGMSWHVALWLTIWIIASWMLYRSWKGKTPWPLGAAMPF